jgi:hypothetical protein
MDVMVSFGVAFGRTQIFPVVLLALTQFEVGCVIA